MRSYFELTHPDHAWSHEHYLLADSRPNWHSIKILAAVTIFPTWIIMTTLTLNPFFGLPVAIGLLIILLAHVLNEVDDLMHEGALTITFVPFRLLWRTLLKLNVFMVISAVITACLWLSVFKYDVMSTMLFLEHTAGITGMLVVGATIITVLRSGMILGGWK